MGYCAEITRGSIIIPQDKRKAALEAISPVIVEFGWAAEVALQNEEIDVVLNVFCQYENFGLDDNDPQVNFSNKWRDDEKLWIALAPFIANESELEFRGEDGSMWRYTFNDGKIYGQDGSISWNEPKALN